MIARGGRAASGGMRLPGSAEDTAGQAIALFDFDHTVSADDSLKDFLLYAVGRTRLLLGALALSPLLVACALGLIPREMAKERVVSHFFGNWKYRHFASIASAYSRERLPQLVRPDALARIRWHQRRGHTVVIVTASLEDWIEGWCREQGLGLIATRLEVENGRVTGRFRGRNCNGAEKVRRIGLQYDLGAYDYVYAYGDSTGDNDMLALADEKYYRWKRL